MRAPVLHSAAATAVTAVLVLAFAGTVPAAPPRVPKGALDPKWDPYRLTFPPLGSLPEVAAERLQLKNGLVLYLVRDEEFPDLQGNMLIGAGTVYDPPNKVGLGSLTGTVLRTGGTTTVPGDALDSRLESIGASLETSVDETSGAASFYCLKEYGDEVLGLLADLLRRPAFPEDKLDLAKVQMRRRIASRNDEPRGIAGRVLRQTIWGKDAPYAREPEFATLEAITLDDLKTYHRRYFVPNHSILTITGDLDPAAMKQKLETLFGDWAPSDEPLPLPPPVPSEDAGGGIYYAEKTQVTQSYVYLGQVGIKADSPDYPAMEVLGELLGGGFSSRILNRIRTQRGLAYSAGARAGIGFAHPSAFNAYALTRSDSTLVTLGLLREELHRIVSEVPPAEEVTRARESLLNSFVFNFQSRGQVANRQAFYEYYGYPPDFLKSYTERLRQVKPEDVGRVAQAHLHPDGMKVIVVGNQADFAQPLSTLGAVTTVDLTIPGAPGGDVQGISRRGPGSPGAPPGR